MADLIQYWLLDPTALLFLLSLSLVVYVVRARSASRRSASKFPVWSLCLLWLSAYALCSSPVVVNPVLTTLEGRNPERQEVCAAGSHVVVLAGGVDSRADSAHQFERMSNATLARATAAWRIAAAEPEASLVVAGGAIGRVTEADVIRNYWLALHVDPIRIITESRSSNTRENALNVFALLNEEQVEGPIRLITSALHMPRALGSFKKVFAGTGATFCPVRVDRQALLNFPVWAWMPQTTAVVKFDKWLHEVVALLIYRLRGWL